MDFLSHPRRSRSLGQIGSISGHIVDGLRAYSRSIVKGTHEIDVMSEYLIRALIAAGCPAELILDAANTTRDFNTDDDALKLYLPFHESSGATCADLSGNSNDGTATGTTIVDGVFGKARSFNGTTDFVDCGNDSSLDIVSTITVEVWMKADNAQVGDVVQPAGKYNYQLVYDHSAAAFQGSFAIKADDWLNCGGPLSISHGVWHLFAGVYDGTYLKTYLDGAERLSNNIGSVAIATGTSAFMVGANPSTSDAGIAFNFFAGLADEPRIYSRALSADEMYLHYLAGALKLGLI